MTSSFPRFEGAVPMAAEAGAFAVLERLVDGGILLALSTTIFGGVGQNPQVTALAKGVDIVVATPGRLLDHVGRGNIDLSRVETLVLDEADRMLDMGFIHDIRKVLALVPKSTDRQTLLFSATFSRPIRELANRLLNRPESIEVARCNATAGSIEQVIHPVDKSRKRELLSHMIGAGNWRQVLVFTRTKHGANRLAKQLQSDGLDSAAIHGNKSQGARERALEGFKAGSLRVLVATDIAARGIDIDEVSHVIQVDLPEVPEQYVHRIGRTARADDPGLADAFLVPQVYNARRFDFDLAAYPAIERIDANCASLPEFIAAAPENQPDAP